MEEKEYTITFTATEMSHLQPAVADRLEQLQDFESGGNDSQELQDTISETSDLLDKINSYSDEDE